MKGRFFAILLGTMIICMVPPAAHADRDLRSVASLHGGIAFPDVPEFGDAYKNGFNLSLDYATRLNRNNRHWYVAGDVGMNRFRSREDAGDLRLFNANANARWYFDAPGERFTGYVGAGPGIYWETGGNSWFGVNVGAGADYPVGSDWSITLDVDQHFLPDADNSAFATVKLGGAYWFR